MLSFGKRQPLAAFERLWVYRFREDWSSARSTCFPLFKSVWEELASYAVCSDWTLQLNPYLRAAKCTFAACAFHI